MPYALNGTVAPKGSAESQPGKEHEFAILQATTGDSDVKRLSGTLDVLCGMRSELHAIRAPHWRLDKNRRDIDLTWLRLANAFALALRSAVNARTDREAPALDSRHA